MVEQHRCSCAQLHPSYNVDTHLRATSRLCNMTHKYARVPSHAQVLSLVAQVIGRGKEVERVIQVLARRSKNNPILLGEPGVGKTAIAEGLAHCIVKGFTPGGQPLPSFLEGKRILQLDVGLLIAGAKERGELERRVTGMLAELQSRRDIILM